MIIMDHYSLSSNSITVLKLQHPQPPSSSPAECVWLVHITPLITYLCNYLQSNIIYLHRASTWLHLCQPHRCELILSAALSTERQKDRERLGKGVQGRTNWINKQIMLYYNILQNKSNLNSHLF